MQVLQRDASGNPTKISLRHFDPHVHGRRIPMKKALLREAAKRMCGGVLEPNTNPHILTCDDAQREVEEANALTPDCKWSASIYLTPRTCINEVVRAWQKGYIAHVKWYPPHGSTHSGESVQPEDLLNKNSPTGKLLTAMAEAGITLKNHGEVTEWRGADIEPDNRERVYYREIQPRLHYLYPGLRQVLAHISTEEAVRYAMEYGMTNSVMFEITGQHLGFNSNIRYDGGYVLPDHHCLPVVKSQKDLEAIRKLLKMKPRFVMAGSDMAAHDTRNKYAFRCFGGFYTYHCSLELYAQLLEQLDLLEYADAFLYGNAKRFHGSIVPDNPKPIALERKEWAVESRVSYEGGEMTPFGFDEIPDKRYKFQWKLAA